MWLKIGHRRNSLERTKGFAWIEVDVILSPKGELLLAHD